MSRYLGDRWVLPALDDLNRPWFTAGVITIQACTSCDSLQHPPEEICRHCQGTALGWRQCSGEGRVESVIVVHHATHPWLKDSVPYAVAVVSLDDAPGVNAIGNILNRSADQIEIGQAVRATFEEVEDPEGGDRLLIPQWEAC